MTDLALPSEPQRRANRLRNETSPYLLQHAFNPVDWYPWGEEAIAASRREQKPIFLSVGYSACHWCHVMEHESFENEAVAAYMNEHFINIKVDREERPDIDQIYMNAVQLMTQHGGWPMSVFMTPDLKPFFGGTYWPPTGHRGMPGFRYILERVVEAWQDRREEVLAGAEEITADLRKISTPQGEKSPLQDVLLRRAVNHLVDICDRRNGGFRGAPKFPHPMDLRLLLRGYVRFGESELLEIARLTLDKMAAGGIYDQLGGGFHRYSTDDRWLVPHFEKMLYDNALLTPAYLEAYQLTGDQEYARIARETCDYLLREMTSPGGGFYATQDADSEGVEGKFFVWFDAEIEKILADEEESRIFHYCYDVSPPGNWEGHNILNRPKPWSDLSRILSIPEAELKQRLRRSSDKLLAARELRVHPGRDDKILASWNGLAISAMSMAGQILGEEKYLTAARRAADFILREMRTEDGRLLHSYKDGRARFDGFLDDYAAMIEALIDVYQSCWEASYLQEATRLAEIMIREFHDPSDGGFFYTDPRQTELITRNKDSYDGSTPSGNSLAATALLRLGRISGRPDLERVAEAALTFMSPVLGRSPMAGSQALLALDFLLGTTVELVLVDGNDKQETEAVLAALHRRFVPNKVIVRRQSTMTDESLPTELKPLLENRTARQGQATIYLCTHGSCGLPVTGVSGLEDALHRQLGVRPRG